MSLSGFFSKKQSFLSSGLFNSVTDIHCHILPGVDDGVSTFDESVAALRWLKNKGITRMHLTPHVMSDLSNTKESLTEQFNHFKNKIREIQADVPELRLAAEYMLDAGFTGIPKKDLLTFGDNHILVETSYISPPCGFADILEELLESGYTPVLAHPERYNYMNRDNYTELKKMGIHFQLNFLSLTGVYGKYAGEKACRLLKQGYYNFTGSDFHNLTRFERQVNIKALTTRQIKK
jgi:tyrosine-protein phosphatase YwqE